ncbi:MAG TPA: hypothetical protein VK890_00380 [Bacteroidia bacterium]|jgi:hypothetical protein|nr:hypothetical protein [Bacteroidia bacterium]
MKKNLLLAATLLCGIINAQKITIAYDSKEMKVLQKATLYVLPTGDDIFDKSMDSAVAKYWKITPYKIITAAEAPKYLKDDDNYFIAPVNIFSKGARCKVICPRTFKSDYSTGSTIYLFRGSSYNKGIDNLDFAADVSASVMPYLDKSLSPLLVVLAVKNLNDNVQLVLDNKIDPVIHASGFLKPIVTESYRKNPGALKTKTLLIDTSLSKATDKFMQLLKVYKYKYQFVNYAQLNTLLSSADAKNYCLMADITQVDGADIYDFETKAKIWSGEIKSSKNEFQDLNTAIQNSKQ